jgi:3-carboxy-cis,cis-muconate cycloisomerase
VTLDPGFTTATSRRIFADETRLQRMLDVEAALAAAQAEVGLIPEAAAAAIAAACLAGRYDVAAIFSEGWEVGTPVLPLVDRLRAEVEPDHAGFVHLGATTQDIVDTGMILQIREGLLALEGEWLRFGRTLAALAKEHRSTPMLGRSFLQAGAPITFGRKVGGWLSALANDLTRLRVGLVELPVQLGGPMGVLRGMGDHGESVATAMGAQLGLHVPAVSWHSDRWPVRSVAAVAADVASTARLIAVDTILLAQSGIGEVTTRAGSSSALAGKRNPIDAIRANAAAQFTAGQAALLLTTGPYEHERATGAWHVEWAAIPLLFHGAMASVEAVVRSTESLVPEPARMADNLVAAGHDPEEVGLAPEFADRAVEAFRRDFG